MHYEDIQVLLKTLNHFLLPHAATSTHQWWVKFWNFLCSALGACFILFCPLKGHLMLWSWGCYCSVAKSCPSLWDPMDCSAPGIPVLHRVLEFSQTHVHWVDDAIQPSRPLSPLPPAAFSPSIRVSSHQMAKALDLQLQQQCLPMNIQGWFPSGLTGLISL